jgi:hypothetical protein
VDGDGTRDLIAGQGHDYGLDWYRQRTEKGGKRTWTRHRIDSTGSQFHTMAWVDLDGDGKPELLTGKRYRAHNDNDPGAHDPAGLYYYGWNGKSFVKTTISYGPLGQGKGTGIYFDTTDLRGTGRPDIVVAGKDGLWVFFNEGKVTPLTRLWAAPPTRRLPGCPAGRAVEALGVPLRQFAGGFRSGVREGVGTSIVLKGSGLGLGASSAGSAFALAGGSCRMYPRNFSSTHCHTSSLYNAAAKQMKNST